MPAMLDALSLRLPQPDVSLHLKDLAAFYRRTLLNDVVPFWLRHGWDHEYGGISNVVDDKGDALNHDKFLWSQGRALWTFSALHRRVEAREEFLAFARHIFQYLSRNGRDGDGRWMYRLDPSGRVLEGSTSIFVDAFVFHGLEEYYRASGEKAALDLACATCENALARLGRPGSYGTAPYSVPEGLQQHGMAMIYSLFCYELGCTAGRQDFIDAGLRYADDILEAFYVPEKNAILEYVTLDGKFHDSPEGRACVPGHALEAMWFSILIYEKAGLSSRIPRCCELILRHLEIGWDEEHGGMFLALDISGRSPAYWNSADCKPWWVQVEALVATAFAWRYTRQSWCLEWHERVREWAFERYPVATGEWRQWLSRSGEPIPSAALPVKDPFHLPRALMYLTEILGSDEGQTSGVRQPKV